MVPEKYFQLDKHEGPFFYGLSSWSNYGDELESLVNHSTECWVANEWQYIAVSWGPAGRKLYVNGVLKSSNSFTGWAISDLGPNFSVGVNNLGSFPTENREQADSTIDELRISNIQRSDTEIRNDYWNGLGIQMTHVQLDDYHFVVIADRPLDRSLIKVDDLPNATIQFYREGEGGERLQCAIDPLPEAYRNYGPNAFAFHHEEQGHGSYYFYIQGLKDAQGSPLPDYFIRFTK